MKKEKLKIIYLSFLTFFIAGCGINNTSYIFSIDDLIAKYKLNEDYRIEINNDSYIEIYDLSFLNEKTNKVKIHFASYFQIIDSKSNLSGKLYANNDSSAKSMDLLLEKTINNLKNLYTDNLTFVYKDIPQTWNLININNISGILEDDEQIYGAYQIKLSRYEYVSTDYSEYLIFVEALTSPYYDENCRINHLEMAYTLSDDKTLVNFASSRRDLSSNLIKLEGNNYSGDKNSH